MQPYIVMEYVAGRTLRDILKTEGRLPARRTLEIGADICGALDFSHRAGIIHRDIKPANVMITAAGAVKVMDFGIARAAGDNAATVTQTANVIGTAQYLSPEQARGESVDARSGRLLEQDACSTNSRPVPPPFQGDSPVAVAYQHVRENPTAAVLAFNPEEFRPSLDSIIMKALAKNQLNRYQSAAEMRTDLQRALANQPVAAEAVMTDMDRTQFIAATPRRFRLVAVARGEERRLSPDPARRTGLIWLAVVIALLLVIGGIVGAVLFITRSRFDQQVTLWQVPNVVGKYVASQAQADAHRQRVSPMYNALATPPKRTSASGQVIQLRRGSGLPDRPRPPRTRMVDPDDCQITYSSSSRPAQASSRCRTWSSLQYNAAAADQTQRGQAHAQAEERR